MIHIVPVTDVREHIAGSTCECGVRYDSEFELLIHEPFWDSGQRWMVVQSGNFEFKRVVKELNPSLTKMFRTP